MTVSKQIADQIFKTSQLDDRINSSAKKLLLKKIEFVEAKEPYSLNLNKLKSKYVVLTSNQKREKTNGVKIVETKPQNDGIPRPKFVLFAAEQVELRWKKSLRAGAGLVNLGNTCFLNSALQCLTYTPPLANYLLSNQHRSQCRVNGGFCMLCSLQQHQGASFGNVGKSIRPMNILKNLRVIAKHLQFGRQEDAHEFIRYSVDAMQKSCLSGQPSKLDIHTKTTTLVYQIFGGYLRSRVKCRQCKAVSDTFDPFLDLSLDINKQDCNDLQRCLQHYVKPELLHGDNLYKCHRCKQAVPASKTFSIHRPPNVLTVQLKRFSSFMGNKINREVTYPSKLNLAPYMSSTQATGPVYDLYAVLVHSGFSCNSGHYYAYAKASNGQWYCFNDSSVNQVSVSHALNQQAYLLFYHRIPEHKHTKQPPKQPILGSMKHEVQMNGSRSAEVHRVGSGPITGRNKPHTTPGNKLLNGESPKWGLTNKFKPRVIGVGDSKKMKVDSIVPSSGGNPAVSSNAKDTLGKNLPNGGVNGHKVTINEVQVSREVKSVAEKQIVKKSCEDVTSRLVDGDPMTPAEQNGPDWLETKLRERRNSAESNRRGNARISFKLKPFSSLPNHQKMWHKFHGKPRDSGCEDEHSTSSNDSRRSDKEKGNHARKLKILSEDADHGRKRRWDEVEDHRAGGSASSAARCQDDEKKNGRTGILSKLLKMSSGKAYGGEVTSWDGGTSMVEEDARRDHVERSKSSTDGWDREFDRGRTKKIKKKKTHRSNTNLFQSFQKYKFATSTASF